MALVSQVHFLAVEPHHPSVSCHAVAAADIEKLEGVTTRIYNHWGFVEKKKGGILATDVSLGRTIA